MCEVHIISKNQCFSKSLQEKIVLFLKKKKKSPYVAQLSSSHFWPETQWSDCKTLSSWKQSPNNINSLTRDPEETMNMKFIFTSLLALALPGNWVLSCIWVALLGEAAWVEPWLRSALCFRAEKSRLDQIPGDRSVWRRGKDCEPLL